MKLDAQLGWLIWKAKPGGSLGRHLYFYSGHGAIFQVTRRQSIFQSPARSEKCRVIPDRDLDR